MGLMIVAAIVVVALLLLGSVPILMKKNDQNDKSAERYYGTSPASVFDLSKKDK